VSSSVTSTNTIAVKAFSKTIAVTYVGLGFFGLIFLIASLVNIRRAVLSRSPLLWMLCAVLFGLGIGLIYVILALRQRRNWARHAALWFWLLCLIWTAFTIVQHGLHPEPAPGPFQYSNADQLAGARLAALVTPYLMAILELTAIYCFLRKANVVNQFKRLGQEVI
jgi:magnesium-transporting ATPase (P-type)